MVKKLILLLLVFFFIGIASAQPPFQIQPTFIEGYFIEIPEQGILKQSDDFTFFFHVFNLSTGSPLDNISVGCEFNLHNSSSKLIYTNTNLPFDASTTAFFAKVKGNNFSALGDYNYVTHCNSTTFGGVVSVEVQVTYSGKIVTTGQSIIYFLLFSVMAFVFVMVLFFIDKLPPSNIKDDEGRIVSISYLKYLRSTFWFVEWIIFIGIIFLASNVAFAYLSEIMFGKILFAFFVICLSLTPLIVALWLVWIFVQMFHDKEFQNLLNRGFFPQGKL